MKKRLLTLLFMGVLFSQGVFLAEETEILEDIYAENIFSQEIVEDETDFEDYFLVEDDITIEEVNNTDIYGIIDDERPNYLDDHTIDTTEESDVDVAYPDIVGQEIISVVQTESDIIDGFIVDEESPVNMEVDADLKDESEEFTEFSSEKEEIFEEVFEAEASVEYKSEEVASGNCGTNLAWILDNEGTLTISGTGEMHKYVSENKFPWKKYSSDIRRVEILSGVTSISDYAFFNYTELRSITIPETVTAIGNYVFEGCKKVTEINIPQNGLISIGNLAFDGLIKVTAFEIPTTVTMIGEHAFGSMGITTVTIPSGVNTIEKYAFSDCKSLTSITLSDNVRLIRDNAFQGCSQLKTINLSNITYICKDAFYWCSSLKVVNLSQDLTFIGDNAFFGCKSLSSVSIPSKVSHIGESAFDSCGLKETVFYTNVVEIDDNCFWGCANDFTIYGEPGSDAESYANNNNLTFVPHYFDEWKINLNASCTEAGEKEHTCKICGGNFSEIIPPLGHKEEDLPAISATCTQAGLTAGKKCSVCGLITKEQTTVSATGHKVLIDPAVAATCTTTGKTAGSHCSVCGEIIESQSTVPATGHKVLTDPAVAVTCTTVGKTAGSHCSVCGKTIKAQTAVPATGHKWSTWTTTKEATALAEGKQTRYCSSCKKEETQPIAKLVASLKMAKTNMSVKKRKTAQIKVGSITTGDELSTATSSNTKIVKVGIKNGGLKITALKTAGTATVTVTTKAGATATINVTVPKVKTTKITCKAVSVKKGKKINLKPKVEPIYSDDKITYKSANKKIATVNAKGVVKGIKKGKTTITVKSGKRSVKVKVTVK